MVVHRVGNTLHHPRGTIASAGCAAHVVHRGRPSQSTNREHAHRPPSIPISGGTRSNAALALRGRRSGPLQDQPAALADLLLPPCVADLRWDRVPAGF